MGLRLALPSLKVTCPELGTPLRPFSHVRQYPGSSRVASLMSSMVRPGSGVGTGPGVGVAASAPKTAEVSREPSSTSRVSPSMAQLATWAGTFQVVWPVRASTP